MRPTLALSPEAFQALAIAWLSVASVVLTALLALITRFWPQIIELKTRFDALHARQDRQGARQNSQDATLARVALATNVQPPAPACEPAPSSTAS